MSNVHGLYSNKKDDDDEEDESNNRYVGGIGARGGGRYALLRDVSRDCWHWRLSVYTVVPCMYVHSHQK
jgi:hypothetical protein